MSSSKPQSTDPLVVKLPESEALWDWVRGIHGSWISQETYRGGQYLQGIRENLGPGFAAFEAECKARNVDMESLYPVAVAAAAEDDNDVVTCTVTFRYKEMP